MAGNKSKAAISNWQSTAPTASRGRRRDRLAVSKTNPNPTSVSANSNWQSTASPTTHRGRRDRLANGRKPQKAVRP